MKLLSYTLRFIGVVQIILGLIFLLIPNEFANALNYELLPNWAIWMYTQMAARFIGYGIGMFITANNPKENLLWIDTMIFIQIIDWIGTIIFLARGATLTQVTTAPFFPVLFVIILGYYRLKLR